ncbi:hypothetical protein DFH06DRAFT_1407115 [Mycena polygramma]|nr:hypothetical protein DFH06DRAFT_1407115 [Mycena polygramma]
MSRRVQPYLIPPPRPPTPFTPLMPGRTMAQSYEQQVPTPCSHNEMAQPSPASEHAQGYTTYPFLTGHYDASVFGLRAPSSDVPSGTDIGDERSDGFASAVHSPSNVEITHADMNMVTPPTITDGSTTPVDANVEMGHTDNAPVKVNSLRRRCARCCTTSTPNWRRSTVDAGKIVCGRCSLLERNNKESRS